MDFSKRRWKKVYQDLTGDLVNMSKSARGTWWEFIRACPWDGRIEIGDGEKRWVVLARILGLEASDAPQVRRDVEDELLKNRCLVWDGSTLVARNHIKAQKAKTCAALRQEKRRALLRAQAEEKGRAVMSN